MLSRGPWCLHVVFASALVAIVVVVGCNGTLGPASMGEKTPAFLAVEPQEVSIEILDGALVTQAFQAALHYTDGSSEIVTERVAWESTNARVGDLDKSGLYTPTGALGGFVTVQATLDGRTTTAELTVKLHFIDNAAAAAPDAQDALREATEGLLPRALSYDDSIRWAYPYHETVFPRGLPAPVLMWDDGPLSDIYYIRLSSATFELEVFANVEAPSRYTIDRERFTQFTESTVGAADLHVARGADGAMAAVIHHTWTIASASLPGVIYYWMYPGAEEPNGRLQRLKPGADAAENFLADYAVDGDLKKCPKCHTPSADGRHLIMTVRSDASVAMNDSVNYDLKTGKTVFYGYANTNTWAGAAVSANGQVVVPNAAPARQGLAPDRQGGAFDAMTGLPLSNTGLEGLQLWTPSFSPDNQLLLYVQEKASPDVIACQTATWECAEDLRVFDWDPETRQVKNDRWLVSKGDDPQTRILQYPTASPDHGLVIYGRGPSLGSISYPDDVLIHGDLFAVHVEHPGSEVPLAKLGGAEYPFAKGSRDRHLDYEPSFAPVASGGYTWVIFISRRTYGNILVNPPYEGGALGGIKQLWVAAIDQNPTPGEDPSHPAFLLPGQEISATDTRNQRARWTLDPCRDDGQACGAGTECCGGYCATSEDGSAACQSDPGSLCAAPGDRCKQTADCCGEKPGVTCINRVCSDPPPG